MRAAMRELAAAGARDGVDARVLSHFVDIEGKRYLAGVAYLQEIDWYEITLLDLDVLMPVHSFASVLIIFAATVLVALLLFNYALNRIVLNPLAALEKAMLRVRDGNLDQTPLPRGKGEIGRLIGHFGAMAESVRAHTRELETRVAERTEALQQLASIDPLTGLLNRRGMTERLVEQISRSTREQQRFGLIWLDIDLFKEINDCFGHAAGDEALAAVGQLLASSVRPYDCAARWGGDEFLVLLSPCDPDTLTALGERIRASVESGLALDSTAKVTVSIGACLASPGESLEKLLHRADQALYAAKAAGRNRLRLADETLVETA